MPIIIPFGADAVAPHQFSVSKSADGVEIDCRLPHVIIDQADAVPLRLNSGGLEFGEPPPLPEMPKVSEQLDYLLAHFQRYCSLWDKHQRAFLERYFAVIYSHIMENQQELIQSLVRFGNLYRFDQWAFSALRPLPRAHLLAPENSDSSELAMVRVDVAFWTGFEIVAIDLIGSETRGKAQDRRRERLIRNGVKVIEIPHGILDESHSNEFRGSLPSDFYRFWEMEALPSGPFQSALA